MSSSGNENQKVKKRHRKPRSEKKKASQNAEKKDSVDVDDLFERFESKYGSIEKASKKVTQREENECGDDGDEVKQPKKKQKQEKQEKVGEQKGEAWDGRREDVAKPKVTKDEGILSDAVFSDLKIEAHLKKAVARLGYERMTHVQKAAIPRLLAGEDVIASARTGSGKTLAFLIPVVQAMVAARVAPRNGTVAIVISPTRELCIQIYGVVRALMEGLSQTHGLVMGGANRQEEGKRLQRGVNLLVATPGRLIDHLTTTKGFVVHNLQTFVMDEADRILEIGFEEDVHRIVKALPKERQTMLFSATMTRNVKDLIRLSMRADARHVAIDAHREEATAHGLTQGYVVVPSEKRFLLLYTFLKKNANKKVIVFFSSCASVKFHAELLNYVDIPVLDLYGKQKQKKRTATFFEFSSAEKGILLCTDVAARGLDIPRVDFIVQYDAPDDPKEYIHRVGRTARGTEGTGKALIFLLPSELGFLQYLRQSRVTLEEYEFPDNKIANVQMQLERLVEKNYYLHKSARDAYRGYMLAYASHSKREIFDVHQLDVTAVAKSFGFTHPPRINLNISATGDSHSQRRKKDKKRTDAKPWAKSGKEFSAANPHGVRSADDDRQFTF